MDIYIYIHIYLCMYIFHLSGEELEQGDIYSLHAFLHQDATPAENSLEVWGFMHCLPS